LPRPARYKDQAETSLLLELIETRYERRSAGANQVDT
jgi:hypothetical protein